MEVERTVGRTAEPLTDVLGIGQRVAQRHNADRLLQLGGDVAHTRADHLQRGAALEAKQLQLVGDEEVDVLHVLALLPAARQHVPVLRNRDQDVGLGQQFQIRRRVAC